MALQNLKRWLRRHLPTNAYNWLRYRGMERPVDQLALGRVLTGPFKGMLYQPKRSFNGHYAMLIGVYEQEIAAVIEDLVLPQSPTIAVIGAAEGYYAVGFARKYAGSRILAYELETWIHPYLVALAAQNDVQQQIELHGAATIELLAAHFQKDAPHLVWMDVEGAENQLADPKKLPALEHAQLIIELHPMNVPDIRQILEKRFAPTHTYHVIDESGRSFSQVKHLFPPEIQPQLERHFEDLVTENRVAPMQWLYLRPKTGVQVQ